MSMCLNFGDKRTNARASAVLGLLILTGVVVLSWHAWDRFTTLQHQQAVLAEKSVQGTASDLALTLNGLAHRVQLFAQESGAARVEGLAGFEERLRRHFPQAAGYRLVDAMGETLLESGCSHGDEEGTADPVRFHDSHRHIDVTAPWRDGTATGLLTVAFGPQVLGARLTTHQIPGSELALAFGADAVAISSDGVPSDRLPAQAWVARGVAGTPWQVLAFPDPESMSGRIAQSARGSVLAFIGVLMVSGVAWWFLRREGARRSVAIASLQQTEELLRAILDYSPAAIYVKDDAGRYVLVNRRFTEQLGGDGEVLGRTDRDIFPAEISEAFQANDAEVLRADEPVEFEEGYAWGGKSRTNLSIKFPLRTSDGLVGVCGISTDITQRKAAENRLRELNRLLQGIFASLDHALFVVDPATRTVVTCNPAAERIFGYSATELVGQRTDLLHESGDAFEIYGEELFNALDDHGVFATEWRMRRKGGEVFPTEHTVTGIVDEDGRRNGLVCIVKDITERKRIEGELERYRNELEERVVERTRDLTVANAELQSFSYSVSHDLRGPLRAINSFSQLLLEECKSQLDPACQGYLERLEGAAVRLSELVDGLLALADVSRRTMGAEVFDFSEAAREITEGLHRSSPGRSAVVNIEPQLWAEGDPALLRVVLEQLLDNAWKFTAHRAMARITVGRAVIEGEEVLFVEDNGLGFDNQYADRLFEPFQRLHRPGEYRGTGVGLATVSRIIHRHGGRVWAEGHEGEGATVYFTLPRMYQAEMDRALARA